MLGSRRYSPTLLPLVVSLEMSPLQSTPHGRRFVNTEPLQDEYEQQGSKPFVHVVHHDNIVWKCGFFALR
jgi:hypothetical protein